MSARSNVLDKLRKLLSRAAVGRGNSEAEMKTAMEAAMRLAHEHNIDLATVEEGDTKAKPLNVGSVQVTTKTKYERPFHMEILNVIRQCLGVRSVYSSYWTAQAQRVFLHITLIGEETDMAMAGFVWDYLQEMFPQCWSEHKKSHAIYSGEWVASRSYWVGLAAGIIEANRRVVEAMPKDQKDKFALVLVNKEALVNAKTAELFPKLGRNRSHQKNFDNGAYSSGVEKGRTIKLNRPLNG